MILYRLYFSYIAFCFCPFSIQILHFKDIMLHLEDRVETWPNKVRGFQSIISSKNEIHNLSSPMSEKPSTVRGSLYNHQKLFREYMIHYDEALIMDPAGVGKTRKALSFPELCVSVRLYPHKYPDLVDKIGKYNKYIILTSGPNSKFAFKKALFCEAVEDDRYNSAAVLNSATTKAQKTNVTKALTRHGYNFATYTDFSKRMALKYNNFSSQEQINRMAKDYSDTIFIVDEVHNLIDAKSEESENYKIMKIVFHYAIRRKVILMSATPMINKANEIIKIANLLIKRNYVLPIWLDPKNMSSYDKRILMPNLPEDESNMNREDYAEFYEPQFPDDYKILEVSEKEIEVRLRGIVFFVKGSESNVKPIEMIRTIGKDEKNIKKLRLYASLMEPYQQERYLDIKSNNHDITPEVKQATMFTYPDSTRANEGYNKYLKNPDFLDMLRDDDELRSMSSKYYAVLEAIQSHMSYDENGKVSDYGGVTLIYIEFVQGAGSELFSTLLKARGYEQYTGNNSAFTKVDDDKIVNFCGGGTNSNDLVPNIPKKLRFSVYTSGETSKTTNIMELQNCKANWNGEYSQICILSKVGQEGVSFQHIRSIHILTNQWNPSVTYQISRRGLRSGSHDHVLYMLKKKALELKQELLDEGRVDEAEQVNINPTLEYKIYRHAAYTNSKVDNGQTIDVQMFLIAEKKYEEIQYIMRILKKISVDCQIQKNRNQTEDEKYECFNKPIDTIDYSTYDLINNFEDIEDYIFYLKQMFQMNVIWTISKIFSYLEAYIPNYRKINVIKSLKYIIMNRIFIIDRYGYKCYVSESGGSFYTRRSYPTELSSISFMNFYSLGLIGYNNYILDDATETINKSKYDQAIEDLKTYIHNINSSIEPNTYNYDSLLKFIKSKDLRTRSRIFEQLVLIRWQGIENEYTKEMVNKIIVLFRKYYLHMREPVNQLETLKKDYDYIDRNLTKRLGKKKDKYDEILKAFIKDGTINIEDIQKDSNYVCVHCILCLDKQAYNSYHTTKDYINVNGEIRICRKDDLKTGWRHCSKLEQTIYRFILRKYIYTTFAQYAFPNQNLPLDYKGNFPKNFFNNKEQMAQYERYPFGISLDNDKFYINIESNSKEITNLRDCMNFTVKEIVSFLVKYKVSVEDEKKVFTDEEIEYMLANKTLFNNKLFRTSNYNLSKKEIVLYDFDTEELVSYYQWIAYTANEKKRKKILCPYVYELLESNDLIIK